MPAYVYIHTSSQLGQENDRRKLEKHPQVVDFYQVSINIVPCRCKLEQHFYQSLALSKCLSMSIIIV